MTEIKTEKQIIIFGIIESSIRTMNLISSNHSYTTFADNLRSLLSPFTHFNHHSETCYLQ